MAKIKVAINGVGRIGRAFFRSAFNNPEIEIVALNDLGDIHNIAYLLKYDSVYGTSPFEITVAEDGQSLSVDGKKIDFYGIKDPGLLPWGDYDVDVVVEATGVFRSFEDARKHIDLGEAKRVVITAPPKSDPVSKSEGIVLMGVNEELLGQCVVTSNASCTTNAGAPLVHILHEAIGIEKAMMNTIHAYTASQNIVDGPQKDFRRGRAGALNMVPTTTGAAIATTKVITDLVDKFDGIAIRVPVAAGSIADITFLASRKTSVEEVNNSLKKAASAERWKGIFTVTEEPLVSSDIVGTHFGAIADLSMTRVVDGDLVKVMSWYDNEGGYTSTLVRHVIELGKHI